MEAGLGDTVINRCTRRLNLDSQANSNKDYIYKEIPKNCFNMFGLKFAYLSGQPEYKPNPAEIKKLAANLGVLSGQELTRQPD